MAKALIKSNVNYNGSGVKEVATYKLAVNFIKCRKFE